MTSRIRASHRGFTLVELLVVIAIIGILSGLALVGISRARTSVLNSSMKFETGQISQALELYKEKHGALPPDGNTAVTTDATKRATAFSRHLNKMFPQRNPSLDTPTTTNMSNLANSYNLVNPSPTSATPYQLSDIDPSEGFVLCLMGFSPNVEQPLTGTGERTPLFQFDQTRLVDPDGDGWWSYKARYCESEYVYFNANTYTDGSSVVASFTPNIASGTARPYGMILNNNPVWASPKTFQLMLAGLDDSFGDGFSKTDQMKIYPSGVQDTTNAPTSINYSLQDMDNIVSFGQASTLESDTDL
ncbi:type II secretion system protein [Bremerella cremea]|uniref:Type II secretion system protein n=1 Tax=Bremerella cremea TaxID=1031537 RepID=A0A368KYX2_9BACT|nr:type II secretion system protein [Bremerella cremea]RCS54552.1 type II secretion system protein [Bremerella cremea]